MYQLNIRLFTKQADIIH